MAATGVTTVTYKNEIKHYKNVIAANAIDEYKTSKSDDGNNDNETSSEGMLSLNALEGQTIRVFDGMVQIYTEEGWTDYATVDDIERQDPFYGTDEKRAAVELEVLNEKLEEAGIVLNEDGKLVKASELADNGDTNSDTLYSVGSILVENKVESSKDSNKSEKNKDKSSISDTVMDQATLMSLAQAALVDPKAAAKIQQAVASGNVAVVSSGSGDNNSYSSSDSSWSSGSSDSGWTDSGWTDSGSSNSGWTDSGSSNSGWTDNSSSNSGWTDNSSSNNSSSNDTGSYENNNSGTTETVTTETTTTDTGNNDGSGEDFGDDVF